MFRDWGNSPLVKKLQWNMSPSRYAWGYLDHMLSYVRRVIADTGNPTDATPGRRIPYSREEVIDTLARRVMARSESLENAHSSLELPIVWKSAMGHQCGSRLQAIEVRINLDRPTGGTHDAMVPRAMSGSPETPILQNHRDSFHTHLLAINGNYTMNVLILRLATLVVTRDYLLNGIPISLMPLYKAVANSPIAEGYCLHALYDSEPSCVEAVKNCFKNNFGKQVFQADNMISYLQELPEAKKALWAVVTSQCNMPVMEEAAQLVYHRPNRSQQDIDRRLKSLTDLHGSIYFFGRGDDAIYLNDTVVDANGNQRHGNRCMHAACSLVLKNGLVTQQFMRALVTMRQKFCTNRINHITAFVSIGDAEAPTNADFEEIARANEIFAIETFGSRRYKRTHDLETKGRK